MAMGGLLALKAAERVAIAGLVLISAELPRDLRAHARSFELREIPEVYGRSVIGWETLPERLLRDDRDLTLADVLRIQHLLGQKPHEAGAARRQMLAGVSVDRRVVAEVPRLVIGGGLDRIVSLGDSERLADWLSAEYEPFGAHSHFGLIAGEHSHQQVAEGSGVPGDAPPVGERRGGAAGAGSVPPPNVTRPATHGRPPSRVRPGL